MVSAEAMQRAGEIQNASRRDLHSDEIGFKDAPGRGFYRARKYKIVDSLGQFASIVKN